MEAYINDGVRFKFWGYFENLWKNLGPVWTAEKFTTVSLFEKSRDYKKIPFVIKNIQKVFFMKEKEITIFRKM